MFGNDFWHLCFVSALVTGSWVRKIVFTSYFLRTSLSMNTLRNSHWVVPWKSWEPMVHRRQTVTDLNPIVLWACAINTDAENPWWRACAEIPSCRLRMLTTHLPATTCQLLASSVRPQSCWSQMMNQAKYHGMDFCTSKGGPKKMKSLFRMTVSVGM